MLRTLDLDRWQPVGFVRFDADEAGKPEHRAGVVESAKPTQHQTATSGNAARAEPIGWFERTIRCIRHFDRGAALRTIDHRLRHVSARTNHAWRTNQNESGVIVVSSWTCC